MESRPRSCLRLGYVAGLGLLLLILLAAGCTATRRTVTPSVAGRTGYMAPVRTPQAPMEELMRLLRLPGQGQAYRSVEMRFICVECHIVQTPTIVKDWNESKHGILGVKCYACHGTHDREFVLRPGPERCQACHALEVQGYRASRHDWSKNPRGPSCKSCHPMHTFSIEVAKNPVTCTQCHLDIKHVQLYPQSKMGAIYRTLGEGSAAFCVTCHKPKLSREQGSPPNGHVANHNVTESRDRERMVQICLDCHSERSAREKLLGSELWRQQWLGEGPQ